MAKILVVDAPPVVYESLRGFLDAHGHTVVLASNGSRGLSFFAGADVCLDETVSSEVLLAEIVRLLAAVAPRPRGGGG